MWKLRRTTAVLACSAFAITSLTGCTERDGPADIGSLPVAATAYPSPTPGGGQVAVSPPQDIQAVAVQIANGGFDADIYTVQSRPARLEVWTTGGPYSLSIEGLLAPQPLDQNGVTVIGLTLPDPGQYTMRLTGQSAATATLDVRAPGSR